MLTDREIEICNEVYRAHGLVTEPNRRSLPVATFVEALLQRMTIRCEWRDVNSLSGHLSEFDHFLEMSCAEGVLEELSGRMFDCGGGLAKASLEWFCAERRLQKACQALDQSFRTYELKSLAKVYSGMQTAERNLERLAHLTTSSVDALSHERLWDFFAGLDAPESKALLPRALELMAFGNHDDAFFVISYLVRMEWWDWPIAERQAIREYLLASFATLIRRYPGSMWGHDIMGFFDEACRLCRGKVGPLLHGWEACRSLPATIHLASLVVSLRTEIEDSFDQARATQRSPELLGWLKSEATERRLESLYLQREDVEHGSMIASAADIVRRSRLLR